MMQGVGNIPGHPNWFGIGRDAWIVAYHGLAAQGWGPPRNVLRNVANILQANMQFNVNRNDAYFDNAVRQLAPRGIVPRINNCVYVAPNIDVCVGPNPNLRVEDPDPGFLRYCDPVRLRVRRIGTNEIEDHAYRFAFMCRVQPDHFTAHHTPCRHNGEQCPDHPGTHMRVRGDEPKPIRAYGLLVKKEPRY